MRKKIKWAAIAVATPVVVFCLLAALFYFPPFQNWAVRQAAAYVSEKTGMQVTVGYVRLAFPLDLRLEQVQALQPNDSLPQVRDTVLMARSVVANVALWPLFDKQVDVSELALHDVTLNTVHFIRQARVQGHFDRLVVRARGIDLARQNVVVNAALLKGAKVDVALNDTAKEDTTKSRNFWKIKVYDLRILQSDVLVHMPGDSMRVGVQLGEVTARGGDFDLDKARYAMQRFDWRGGQLSYSRPFASTVKGFDYQHVRLTAVGLGIDSLSFAAPRLSLSVRHVAFREQSGLQVTQLRGHVQLDGEQLRLPDLWLKLGTSQLQAQLAFPFNTFATQQPGRMILKGEGAISKRDLQPFAAYLPKYVWRAVPPQPLHFAVDAVGNLRHVALRRLSIRMSPHFALQTSGQLYHVDAPEKLRADVRLKLNTYQLNPLLVKFNPQLARDVSLPNGMVLQGNVSVRASRYASQFTLLSGLGSLRGNVAFDVRRQAYRANLIALRFPVQDFVRQKGFHAFTGDVVAAGAGFDMLSPRTHLKAKAHVVNFRYDRYRLNRLAADVVLEKGRAHAVLNSQNALAKGRVQIDALVTPRDFKGTVSADLAAVDLYHLGFFKTPFSTSLCAHVDVTSNFKNRHLVQGVVSDITLVDNQKIYRPGDISLDIRSLPSSTHAVMNSGDFRLALDGQSHYERLLAQAQGVVGELQRQLKKRIISQVALRERLPNATLVLQTGQDNFFVHLLNKYGYQFARANINMVSSRETGLNGDVHIDSLIVDSMQFDTAKVHFQSDHDEFTYHAEVINNKHNPQYVFRGVVDGQLNARGTFIRPRVYDAQNRLGIDVSLNAEMEPHGLRFSLQHGVPVLGYKTFAVNDSNYVFLGNDQRVSANLKLQSKDGMGVQVYTNDDNHDVLQDLTVSLQNFNLHGLLSVLPYAPDVSGIMNGDYHIIQTKHELSVSSDMTIDKLVYQHCAMGDIGAEFVYMPSDDGTHSIDGTLTQNGREIATLSGSYHARGGGALDAQCNLERLPLGIVNGFIPKQIVGFKGFAEGRVSVKGTLNKPKVQGEVYLDSAYLVSQPYGVELRFDNDPVTITNSRLLLENFQMYAHNDSPLVMAGYVDFSNPSNMNMNVRMQASNFLVIDAKESAQSEAYGKAFVNIIGSLSGPLDNLSMRGKVDVLGASDLIYVLRDSPISTDDKLEGLVKFTDFTDNKAQVVKRPELNGFNMDVVLGVDEAAHVLCALNSDKSNYLDLTGGGTLRMQYNAVDNLRLRGRYTLNNGEMKYSLPVIPLKTFTIHDGSYVEFNGDPMNPRLNITATEAMKATVSSSGGVGRSVDFDCGVKLTKTLKDMGLAFIIDAPEDLEVQNQLNTMGTEARGKVAVTMLTTGMYLVDGNTRGFSMNSALSSFLQSQINGIAGNALRTLDLSFGMDNTTDATGRQHTDYSFKFAKRFWNNRLRIIVGGKVSTGSDVPNQNENIFSNVSFEYRLNEASTQYLRLFYDRDSYDWLEGNTGIYGAGFIWRRKLSHFSDLLRFKEPKEEIPALQNQSKQNEKGKNEK